MTNFQSEYRRVYERLGFPLTARDELPEEQIIKAEKRLGVKLPGALREFYLVAGREKLLNHIFNRMRPADEWELHLKKLVFMDENQWAVSWGVDIDPQCADDPAVYQSAQVDGELRKWYQEQKQCSVFIKVMLHWQAAFGGGMKCMSSAPAPSDLDARLGNGWEFAGEVNSMRAYGRPGQAICVLPWSNFFEKKKVLRIFAGAPAKPGLDALGKDLGLKWD